jgi:hypothetical protein
MTDMPDANDFVAAARAVLRANDRGGYTVPTAKLYPFQWNWDSAFVAMGFATFDPDRALIELEYLAKGQWADGMIPHIVFHAPADTYFPGPEVWGTRHAPPTSGITQPPVFATALRFVAERAGPAADARVAALTRVALANHRWWAAARDPEGRGEATLLHNWESGRDNAPAWDAPLGAVPTTTTTAVKRKDTGHVDADMRPRDEDYQRYIHLVDAYRAAGWDPARMWEVAPFKVADPGVTALLLRAEEDLSVLARTHAPEAVPEIEARIARLSAGLTRLWRDDVGYWCPRDARADRPILVPSSGGALGLATGAATGSQVERLAREIEGMLAAGLLPVPSATPDSPGFDAKRYWRGPVWAVVNWMIADGLARHGRADLARALDRALLAAIEREGFCEYFDPTTGRGLGGAAFSWTAAAYLVRREAS